MSSYRYDTATSAWTIDAPEDEGSFMSGMGMGMGAGHGTGMGTGTGTGTGLATNSSDLHEGDDK